MSDTGREVAFSNTQAWWNRPAPSMGDWVADALCAQVGGEFHFPSKGESTAEARLICGRCTVAADCLEYALAMPGVDGIYGGTSPRQRHKIQQERQRARA